MKKSKLIVIGLDGATFDVIDPMVENGELPNLAKLIKHGTKGILKSTNPPITPTAWTTFSTGKNPGKHGVLYWTTDAFQINQEKLEFTNYQTIKCPTFWDILSKREVKMGIINLPGSYPPSPLNGFLISGMDTPNDKVTFSYPADLIENLNKEGIPYRPDCFFNPKEAQKAQEGQSSLHEIMKNYIDIEEKRHKAILHLMEKKEWDMLVVVLGLTDRISHQFWKFHDCVEDDSGDNSSPFKEVVRDSYRKVDGMIGDILKKTSEETNVIIMSDHGFGPANKMFFINQWLKENGFLKLVNITPFNFVKYYKIIRVTRTGAEFMAKLGFGRFSKYLPSKFFAKRLTVYIPFRKSTPELVDWEKTVAYAGGYGIYINLKGRTKYGIVEKGKEYEEIRDKIIDRLKLLKDPSTGKPVMDSVLKKEDVYSGPYMNEAPDVMFLPRDLAYFITSNYYFRHTFKKKSMGYHRFEGIFIARGQNIKNGHEVEGANICDIMPTFFYMMGQPIADDLDGEILTDIFHEDFVKNNQPSFIPPEEFSYEQKCRNEVYNEGEKDDIAQKLRSLGYID